MPTWERLSERFPDGASSEEKKKSARLAKFNLSLSRRSLNLCALRPETALASLFVKECSSHIVIHPVDKQGKRPLFTRNGHFQ